jgi:arylsulfatase A-like enzyme
LPGDEPGVSDALIELADLGPTLVELAGLPPQRDLDARSFADLLTGPTDRQHRAVAVCTERHYIALRSTTHKYINNTGEHRLSRPDELDECYDLVADPTEERNLFVEDQEQARAIRDRLIELAAAEGHSLARLRPR